MRGPLLERMPPFEGSRIRATQNATNGESEEIIPNGISSPDISNAISDTKTKKVNDSV